MLHTAIGRHHSNNRNTKRRHTTYTQHHSNNHNKQKALCRAWNFPCWIDTVSLHCWRWDSPFPHVADGKLSDAHLFRIAGRSSWRGDRFISTRSPLVLYIVLWRCQSLDQTSSWAIRIPRSGVSFTASSVQIRVLWGWRAENWPFAGSVIL
jgi:hypothetical protein